MRKVAFVVEGKTELIFIRKLIEYIVGTEEYLIELIKHTSDNQMIEIIDVRTNAAPNAAKHKIQIIWAGNDDRVLSYISNRIESFRKSNFDAVFGLRDLFNPGKYSKPPDLDFINSKTQELAILHNIKVELVVAHHEIETWFLAVPEFILRIDPTLTKDEINTIAKCDLFNCNIEEIEKPAKLLNIILGNVGGYDKSEGLVERITSLLDLEEIYLNKRNEVIHLGKTINQIDYALSCN